MENKKICYILYAAIAVALIVITTAFYINSKEKVEKPKVIPQSTMSNTVELAKEIKVTPKQAEEIVNVIPQSKPVITYTVVAPTVEKAAVKTAEAIKNKLPDIPKEATAYTDRTVVVPNTDKQKVDVYKINLNKEHKIKAGVTVIDDKVYPTVGYQAGRVEGLVQFDGSKIKGATVMYTMAQW
ncbi:hypothetical protein [uncultured Veillonella sp.]|uniref:hypothetical protein n=1 Tax=uncultured Veillonella sp. TaxID=159268 RepID=UPI0025FE1C93|nr:hypothetical protein [uncultured Veillonella sp.]